MKVIFDGTLAVLAFLRTARKGTGRNCCGGDFMGLVTKMLRRPFACFERKYLP